MAIPFSVRSYLAEPAVADPPARPGRDRALVAAAAVAAVAEAALRTDADWTALPPAWRVASLAALLGALPALLVRRTRPLLAVTWGFALVVGMSALAAAFGYWLSGLISGSVLLVTAYALYRWGSGRDGAIGAGVLLIAWVGGTITGAKTVGDVIGGFIVLCLPVEIGLTVRYYHAARERAIAEATTRERAELARELHDTIAHHMSAIAVQAQAGRAVAGTDPDRAVAVLAVIETAAKEALSDMRAIVRVWRSGQAEPDLAPLRGLAELPQLARHRPGEPAVEVEVADGLGPVDAAVGAALYRIAQESVTNAIRHARRAARVQVRVTAEGDLVRLTVADDGRGNAGPRADGPHADGPHAEGYGADGYGLLGMAERAQLLGGRFTAGPADNGAGSGWLVTAVLPRQVA
ncbi:MAG: histidine kinase [Acidimicrobiales bacterium]